MYCTVNAKQGKEKKKKKVTAVFSPFYMKIGFSGKKKETVIMCIRTVMNQLQKDIVKTVERRHA